MLFSEGFSRLLFWSLFNKWLKPRLFLENISASVTIFSFGAVQLKQPLSLSPASSNSLLPSLPNPSQSHLPQAISPHPIPSHITPFRLLIIVWLTLFVSVEGVLINFLLQILCCDVRLLQDDAGSAGPCARAWWGQLLSGWLILSCINVLRSDSGKSGACAPVQQAFLCLSVQMR